MGNTAIDGGMTVGIEQEIIAELSMELQSDPAFNLEVLSIKVRNAMREVIRARNYPGHFSDMQIEKDIRDYYSNIRNIALYDYNQIGSEFESSHSENSVSRSWIERERLFDGVYAFIKVV